MTRLTRTLRRLPPIAGIALLVALHVNAATIGVSENLGPWAIGPTLPAEQRGIYVNLAEAIAARATTPIEIKFVPYRRMLQQVKSGELDHAFGVVGPATLSRGAYQGRGQRPVRRGEPRSAATSLCPPVLSLPSNWTAK